MCNCSKPVTYNECQYLKKYANDPEGRFFIYHIFDDERRLRIAQVKSGESPNIKAMQEGFIGKDGLPEWYNVKEHPCIYEEDQKT